LNGLLWRTGSSTNPTPSPTASELQWHEVQFPATGVSSAACFTWNVATAIDGVR
jgi:hypothetical protein